MGKGHSTKLYLNVFLILLALTIITVVLARTLHFSPEISIIVALTIATVKASFVIWYFMHMKTESKLLWIYAIFPVIILGILVGGVFLDNPFRDNPTPITAVAPK